MLEGAEDRDGSRVINAGAERAHAHAEQQESRLGTGEGGPGAGRKEQTRECSFVVWGNERANASSVEHFRALDGR